MFYKNNIHKKIYEEIVKEKPYKYTSRYLSAIYLLCADKKLWCCVQNAIRNRNINFEKIDIRKISPFGYSLYKIAQDIYTEGTHITLSDICDTYLISQKTFEMIITALRINRDGYSFVGIQNLFN